MTSTRKLITVLIPVFNEEDNVLPAYTRVRAVMDSLSSEYDFEILFTDNHSTDLTFERLHELAQKDPRVKVLRFSRNFGFQRSILTGYLRAEGDAAVQLDCDLQDPPELIRDFIEKWERGYKVVYGVRRGRPESKFLSGLRRSFYRLIDSISEQELPRNAGDFRLVDRAILDELHNLEDQQPYLRGTIAALGFRQTGIVYDRDSRQSGKSKFPLPKLVSLAFDGIFNHSILPLRLSTYLGLVLFVCSGLATIFYLVGKLVFNQPWPAGFATITILLFMAIGLNALFLGILGEYVGRIYSQVKKGPLTVVEIELNFQPKKMSG